ncbi:hypothetical protein CU669_16815 [Paramagnetospirillum kuznetsovii]|uniref:Uncharacterized protein n=1 Tax=Paramagnetospirillum kuznetsovii TaxID=2053833 RepID=A0A364NV14_9PROT|nr:hypothetical protein [Paramagnetospirillum kuznetsovii]RAU20745.1 hypothetical protein CU669_16815 [Paramagnetospirillum kuznetsovii]
MVKIPAAGTSDDIILGSWLAALVEATACHIESSPVPWKYGPIQLRKNHCHSAEPQSASHWAIWMEGRDFRDSGLSLVLPNPQLRDAWAWLDSWWTEDYLPRHPAIALREAMSDVACAQEYSSWMWNTEIVAWELMFGEIDTSSSRWRGETHGLAETAAELRRLHSLVDGWWIEGDENAGWVPVFIDAEAWEIRRREKWEGENG